MNEKYEPVPQEIPEPVSTNSLEENEKVEDELSPEQIEQIMAKVKDVNEKGTMFTGMAIKSSSSHKDGKRHMEFDGNTMEVNKENIQTLSLNSLSSVLQNGLLGSNFFSSAFSELSEAERNDLQKKHGEKNKWFKEARKERSAVLFANIVGRDIPNLSEAHTANNLGNFGVIYSSDSYIETFPFGRDYDEDTMQSVKTGKTHTFRAFNVLGPGNKNVRIAKLTHEIVDYLKIPPANLTHESLVKEIKSKKNEIATVLENCKNNKYLRYCVEFNNTDEYIEALEKTKSIEELMGNPWNYDDGFILFRRVAPRHFKGIIIKSSNMKDHPGTLGEKDSTLQPSKQEVQEIVQGAVNLMKKINKDSKKNILLPIYNITGDLLWPIQMSYEEVKKFVAERNANEYDNKEN